MLTEKSVNKVQGRKQYCANIAMKINAKLGGINSYVDDVLFRNNKIMQIGAGKHTKREGLDGLLTTNFNRRCGPPET